MRPLRILFTINTPWTETLGAPRVSIELARELTALGHEVSKFSLEDASAPRGRIGAMFTDALFQRALLRHIQEFGSRYDVIQAEHNMLVFPRPAYRFNGLLVAKSNGLRHFYDRFRRGPERMLQRITHETGTLGGNVLRSISRWAAKGFTGAADRSFHCADQIHLLNEDEVRFVRDDLGHGDKCVLIDNGLSSARAAALSAAATTHGRLRSHTIVFVGAWCLRKGKVQFPAILRGVRRVHPDARLRLAGVYASSSKVLSAFEPEDRASVEVIEHFEPDELPNLLADARVGLFPSYIEGFGLGVLEMLAAGLPVVAWDVPGPRQLLSGSLSTDLVPAGDVSATISQLVHYLGLSNEKFHMVFTSALTIAAQYTTNHVAKQFLDAVHVHRNSQSTYPILAAENPL